MPEVNIPEDERLALDSIDPRELDGLIDKALSEERADALHRLPLDGCGPFVDGRLERFRQALSDHGQAKAPRKRAETEERARRAGRDLAHAVSAMKHRLAREVQEDLLFHVDDRIMPPLHPTRHLSVSVGYRWRRSVDDAWDYGSITFRHDVEPRPDYAARASGRKPTARDQARETREDLYRTWEYLASGALQSVKEFLKAGGAGTDIPETYQVPAGLHSRGLDNHSTKFWREPS